MKKTFEKTWHYRLVNTLTAWGVGLSVLYAGLVAYDYSYYGNDFLQEFVFLGGILLIIVLLLRASVMYVLYARFH